MASRTVPITNTAPEAPDLHTTHRDVVNRLKRADGHLQKIIAMIESGRPCVEVAQQMHAVVRALESAKGVLIYDHRSEEHTSELQSLMRISYAVFCLKKKKQTIVYKTDPNTINSRIKKIVK